MDNTQKEPELNGSIAGIQGSNGVPGSFEAPQNGQTNNFSAPTQVIGEINGPSPPQFYGAPQSSDTSPMPKTFKDSPANSMPPTPAAYSTTTTHMYEMSPSGSVPMLQTFKDSPANSMPPTPATYSTSSHMYMSPQTSEGGMTYKASPAMSTPATPQNFQAPSTSAATKYASTAQVFSVPRMSGGSSTTAPSHYTPAVQLYDLDTAGPSTSSAPQYHPRVQMFDLPRGSGAGPSTSRYSPIELYDLDQPGPSNASIPHYTYDMMHDPRGPSTSSAQHYSYPMYQTSSSQMPGLSSQNTTNMQMFEVPRKKKKKSKKSKKRKNRLNALAKNGTEQGPMGDNNGAPGATVANNYPNPNAQGGDNDSGGPQLKPGVKVYLDQERFLPIANVVRIMKSQMDPQAKLAKDAKESVQECVSEFICFIASEAAQICAETKRKTITADDLLTALESTGFDNFAEPMRIFLQKYRQQHKITGPIHREHQNYSRPPQFCNDPPVPPLFFNTPNGRRATETQYVINGHEVIKTAPFHNEWNEQTGTPRNQNGEDEEVEEEEELEYIDPNQLEEMEDMDVIEEVQDLNPLGGGEAISLEQQAEMQIYVDPKSKQHYAARHTANGMELYPLYMQGTPLQLENVAIGAGYAAENGEEPQQIEEEVEHLEPEEEMMMPVPNNHLQRRQPPPPPTHRYRQLDDDEEEDEDDDLMQGMADMQHQQPQHYPEHQQQQYHQQQHHQQHLQPQQYHNHQYQGQQYQQQHEPVEPLEQEHPLEEPMMPMPRGRVLPQPPHRSLPRAVPQQPTPIPRRAAPQKAAPKRAAPQRAAAQKGTPQKARAPPKRSPAKKKK